LLFFILIPFLFFGCDPFVTDFDLSEPTIGYISSSISEVSVADSVKVMTWNIRFGSGRTSWFGDSCGERVIINQSVILDTLSKICQYIKDENIDILLLQEVDASSKRSGYIDQIQYILNNTDLNYGTYASMWQADYIPSDGLGKVDVGNAILSKWPISDAERIQLPLRSDQDPLKKYFYLRRNLIKALIDLPNDDDFYIVNIHATAFATDDTKQKQVDTYKSILENLDSEGYSFVTGGDLNSIPPIKSGGDIYYGDYCSLDICQNEVLHPLDSSGNTIHLEGSFFDNFEGELVLMEELYNNYSAAISLEDISHDHFTHSTWNTSHIGSDKLYWDRKLDYLFTNNINGKWKWLDNSSRTHQDVWMLSDHAPVSGILVRTID